MRKPLNHHGKIWAFKGWQQALVISEDSFPAFVFTLKSIALHVADLPPQRFLPPETIRYEVGLGQIISAPPFGQPLGRPA